jgi:hypothetical protein
VDGRARRRGKSVDGDRGRLGVAAGAVGAVREIRTMAVKIREKNGK